MKGEGEVIRIELQRFLSQKLCLGEDVLADTGECSVRRIPQARGNGAIKNKITVEFPSVDLRNVVRGAAYNLAGQPDAGIRLEIAHHLMANFKALSAASFKLKQKYKDCKPNIKYNDEEMDLILDFRTTEMAGWRRLKPAQTKELMKEGGDAAEEMSCVDMSELLNNDSDQDM